MSGIKLVVIDADTRLRRFKETLRNNIKKGARAQHTLQPLF